jgi:DNA-binding beta-propeller fold protein YncE
LLGLVAGSSAPVRADVLYVSERNNTITQIDSATQAASSYASAGLSNPQGMAFDSAGNLYVANADANTIERFTPGGASTVFATGLSHPIGLAFDTAGNLYVVNGFNNTIERFTSGGVGSLFATLSGGPEYLTIQTSASAVPEPSGLVLLGIGGSLLLVLRRTTR